MANFFKPAAKKQKTEQILTTTITHVNYAGCGVGRYKKLPLFVEGALAGETVEVKIIDQKSKYVKAQLLNVLTPSIERVKPECKHFQVCGGCDLQHMSYNAQIALKKETITSHFSRHGFTEELPWQTPITSQAFHYRRKARIGVQYNKHSEAIVGFRQKATNNLTVIKQCPVLAEPLSQIFPVLKEIIDQLTIKEAIGHVEVIETEQVTLVIRVVKKLSVDDIALWQQYALQHNWQVILDSGKSLEALTSISSEKEHLHSLSYLIDNDVSISFSSQDFIQVNHTINQKMISTALDWLALNKQDSVLDLFCGLGNFSLPIAKQVKNVVGIEGVQSMVDKAADNAKLNQLTNCQFYQADLNANWGEALSAKKWLHQSFTKVVLDPARAGALEAVQQFKQLQVNTILYVSCDVVTLARDTQALAKQGYKIQKLTLMDMFSQTKHIETMVLFSR